MNRISRILLALAAFAAVLALGARGTAWAEKLELGDILPGSVGLAAAPTAVPRPAGTIITNPHIFKLTAHRRDTVASCTTVRIDEAPAGVTYTATVVSSKVLGADVPGILMSCVVTVEASAPASSLGTTAEVCFPLPPTKAGFAYYFDGSKWVKTTQETKGGQSCVEVPASAGKTIWSAMFDK